MQTKGIVKSTDENYAIVEVKCTSACGHDCSECGVCTAPVKIARALNTPNANVGDEVIIETSSKGILSVAFLIYIVPVVIIIFSLAVGKTVSYAICALMLLIWIGALKYINKKYSDKSEIIKIL